MEHRGSSVCWVHAIASMPSPGLGHLLLPAPHPLQQHTPATQCTSSLAKTTIKSLNCVWTYSFLQYWVLLKFSTYLIQEAAGLKVWRLNSCSFNPHCFLTAVAQVIFITKTKICKINIKTTKNGEYINILDSHNAILFMFLSTVVSVVLIFKL